MSSNKFSDLTVTKEQFRIVIEKEQTDLILIFVKIREIKSVLENFDIQKRITDNYMKFGNKMYYGIEMLSCIYKYNWNNDLTIDLCRNIMKCIKTKDI